MTPVLIVEAGIAAHLDGGPIGIRVLPRERSPRWSRGNRWAALDVDVVLEALDEVPRPSVVLARTAAADPGAACLPPVARLLGHEVIRLPDGEDEAAWSAAVAGELGARDGSALLRALHVLCCGPSIAASFPRRPWGRNEIDVPALRPATLARWAYCSWRPCGRCPAGAVSGMACRGCGATIDDADEPG